MNQPDENYEPLRPEQLTWAVLLAQWTEFSRSAVALPADEQGTRMRESVADIITLQAVWFSLQHLDELNNEQRRLGLDRAAVLIERASSAIEKRFTDEVPELIQDLIRDASLALSEAGEDC